MRRRHRDADAPDLGPCCACGRAGADVRNVVMLPVRAPVPGTGWGCLVCDLPSDGAVAVVCDACLAANVPIVHVCVGYAGEGERMPREGLIEPFDHDRAAHAAGGD